jgi:membrane glycosyltransferase
MSSLAVRLEEPVVRIAAESVLDPWLPEEAPLAMPRHGFEDCNVMAAERPATSPAKVVARRVAVFGATIALTILVAAGPYALASSDGMGVLEAIGFGAFVVLALAISCWFCSAIAGFTVLMRGREQEDLDFAPHPSAPTTRTALLMPVYNEDPEATMGRLRAMDASLARLGVSDAFDIFVLSDTRRPEIAATEDGLFRHLRLVANSRTFLRRREHNTEHKAGNIAEWTRRFGGAYDFMIVLDADSTMAGETITRLVNAMERNPGVGLIQTAPVIVGAATPFARMSQFGVRMYGRVAAAGLAWWAGAEGSYWGHNAIVRVKAFAEAAGLPHMPGRKPFGGHIMSHDVVEAALLRRAGWSVHITAALDGSCEETPPTLLDFIRRDHRWCQGNLQHLRLIRAEGLNPISRLQLAMGCMAYIASPLWLITLIAGVAIQIQHSTDYDWWWYMLHPRFTAFQLGTLLAGALLVGPKVMGSIVTMSRRRERMAFGGARTILKGVAMEMAMSAVLAPILMIANTRAVWQILSGRDAGWQVQQREADGLAIADAKRAMRWQRIAGAVMVVFLALRPDLALGFAPLVLPLLFAPQLAVITSRRAVGDALAAKGYLVTPADDGVAAAMLPIRGEARAYAHQVAQAV